MIRDGRPKTTIPILAARGSPSSTELTDQAIQNNIKNAPKQVILHNFQFISYLLYKRKNIKINKQVKNPKRKNNTSIPENIIVKRF